MTPQPPLTTALRDPRARRARALTLLAIVPLCAAGIAGVTAHAAGISARAVATSDECMVIAVHDSYSTPLDTQLTVDPPGVLGNDLNECEDLFLSSGAVNSQPAVGTLQWGGGNFVYTPPSGFTGQVSFVYELYYEYDGHPFASGSYATVTITVGDPVEPGEPSTTTATTVAPTTEVPTTPTPTVATPTTTAAPAPPDTTALLPLTR